MRGAFEQVEHASQAGLLLGRQAAGQFDQAGDDVAGAVDDVGWRVGQQSRDRRQCRLAVAPDQQALPAHQFAEPRQIRHAEVGAVKARLQQVPGMAEMASVGLASGLEHEEQAADHRLGQTAPVQVCLQPRQLAGQKGAMLGRIARMRPRRLRLVQGLPGQRLQQGRAEDQLE